MLSVFSKTRPLQVRATAGAALRFDPEPIAAGAEKICFAVDDGAHVILLFLASAVADRGARVERLQKLLHERNVVERSAHPAYWRDYFCWPTGLIEGGLPTSFLDRHQLAEPALGIVAPRYRAPFYFQDRTGQTREGNARWFTSAKARRIVPAEELGNFLTRLQICTRIARAAGKLHAAGLAHSDLSNKNVLISPRAGDACVIDVDALVVPGLAPPAVLGTTGYIAPEVLMQRAAPGMDADRFALGVLIYELLLQRHPLARVRPLDRALSPAEDEFLAYGEKALFVEHPTDPSNRPAQPFLQTIADLGRAIAGLFLRLFVEGLHEPARRPTAAEWEIALSQTFDLLHPSPAPVEGRDEWFVIEPGHPPRCPWSGRLLPAVPPIGRFKVQHGAPEQYVDDGRALVIWSGLRLMSWHATGALPGPASDRTPLGYFSLHEKRWFFVNQSASAIPLEGGAALRPVEAIELRPGLRIRLGSGASARVLEFEL